MNYGKKNQLNKYGRFFMYAYMLYYNYQERKGEARMKKSNVYYLALLFIFVLTGIVGIQRVQLVSEASVIEIQPFSVTNSSWRVPGSALIGGRIQPAYAARGNFSSQYVFDWSLWLTDNTGFLAGSMASGTNSGAITRQGPWIPRTAGPNISASSSARLSASHHSY